MKQFIGLAGFFLVFVAQALRADDLTPDPTDMYCEHWDAAHKSAFLEAQEGQTITGDDPDSSQFVFYETPAHHDHGLPTGECGVRVLVYRKSPNGGMTFSGKWENLADGMSMDIIGGSHHCYFEVFGGGDEEGQPFTQGRYFIDDSGQVTAELPNIPIDNAVWVTQNGRECFWINTFDSLILLGSEGQTLWSRPNQAEIGQSCFSLDKLFDFRLSKYPERDTATVFSQDGQSTWNFPMPFREVKGHKEVLGFDSKDQLILRVDRKIYRVDRQGNAVLAAEWPLYHGRHNSLETTRAKHGYDVDFSSAVTHLYEYATNVERPTDHPRPQLEFNIDSFEARESLDEGKTWHPVSLKPEEETPTPAAKP